MTSKPAGVTWARAIVILGTLPLAQSVYADIASATRVRESANKATRLMEASMAKVNPTVPCVSCHHGMLPLWTLGIARDHGVTVNETQRRQTALNSFAGLGNLDAAIQGTHVVDETLSVSELLAFGPELGVAPSVATALHARRLASLQQADGHWKTMDARPPQSYSHFMTTAVAAKTLAAYMPDSSPRKAAGLAKAREWLANSAPVSTEDATFRVLGLAWLGATSQQLDAAAKDLTARQNGDGGWSPMPGRESDAYATGEALFAIRSTHRVDDKAYGSGIEFLLRTQLPDGSWHVKTRLHEVAHVSPPKMETGFPHGPDQILSMYGTTWAVAALSLALPEQRQPATELPRVGPETEKWVWVAAFGTPEELDQIDANAKTAKGSTALMVAAADPVRAARLIARGADVKALAQSGQSAVSVAATYAGTGDLVRQLLKLGVPARLGPKTEFHANPLVEVAWTGDVAVARALLDAGGDMMQPMLREGVIPMSPLKAAVALNSPEILREYLLRGADPNSIDDVPLLSWAALANRADVAKVLLEAGADPELRDHYGWTPLRHSRGIDHDVNATEGLIRAAIESRKPSLQ